VSSSSKGKQALGNIEKACNMPVWLVLNLDQARTALESNEYSALVVDQAVLDTEPDASSNWTSLPVTNRALKDSGLFSFVLKRGRNFGVR
jgi:hypothetical protein